MEAKVQVPTVGRIVHYRSTFKDEKFAYAAIVTQVNEDLTIELATFGPNSVYFQHAVKFGDSCEPGTASYPTRV